MSAEITLPALHIVPANKASWEDLQTVFGPRGDAHRCQCQKFKMPMRNWHTDRTPAHIAQRMTWMRAQARSDEPEAEKTTGLLAYLEGEPVGWCRVEPRRDYVYLSRAPWVGRDEDPAEEGIWAVSCFVVRTGYRHRRISYALAKAAVEFARGHGATAVEGYAMRTEPGKDITWGELHVGAVSVFAAAGLHEISYPSSRRVVMRIDF